MSHASRYRLMPRAAMLAAVVALGACTVMPTDPEPSPELTEALDAREAGDVGRAARAYADAAAGKQPPDSEILRLTAAWFYIEAGEVDTATELFEAVETDEDSPELLLDLHHAVEASLALQRDAVEEALTLVGARLPSETVAARKLLLARARGLTMDGRLLDAVEARAALEPLLPTDWERDSNRAALWDTLGDVPMARLREIMPPPPDDFGAWVELEFLTRAQRFDPPTLEESLRLWESRYPDHPAADRDYRAELLARHLEGIGYPERIAVLLPLSGDLADAGRAVRDGMLAAYFHSDAEDRPVLIFHDVGDDGEDPWAAYMRAAQDGADLVIGPLTRPAVQVFAEARSLPVPVLALNGAPDELQPPTGLYRFGLLPEDDARAAARYAYASGQRHVAVLVPDGDWGRRVGRAFSEELEAAGGVVVGRQSYSESSQDHAFSLRRLFALEDSDTRRRRVQGTVGGTIEYEPRRRQDIDAIFVGAFQDQARVIRPQIRFHQGTTLPVLTTSHAYVGRVSDADSDLVGVTFFDSPWSLGESTPAPDRRTLERMLGGNLGNHGALYGLGADAYRLIPQLRRLRDDPAQRIDGATGTLWIDQTGHVRRDLLPARFQRDRVDVLGNGTLTTR